MIVILYIAVPVGKNAKCHIKTVKGGEGKGSYL